ncbi:cupredoxin family copper-binding protein [Trinickia sp. NRRL B-1857]|uniref:cupredoxin domain-containing protein n=1 Tax=Trinickia sp. NRRL B-1857 TaxID=3162879 RepID=UPI003D2DF3AA
MKTFAPRRRSLLRALACAPIAALAATALVHPVAALAASNGTGDASGKNGATYRIEIHDFAFTPKELTVPAGARIVWVNRDDEPHTVVSAAGAFKPSQALDTDDSFTTVLDKPGTYAYFCGIHPMMVGKIVVR